MDVLSVVFIVFGFTVIGSLMVALVAWDVFHGGRMKKDDD